MIWSAADDDSPDATASSAAEDSPDDTASFADEDNPDAIASAADEDSPYATVAVADEDSSSRHSLFNIPWYSNPSSDENEQLYSTQQCYFIKIGVFSWNQRYFTNAEPTEIESCGNHCVQINQPNTAWMHRESKLCWWRHTPLFSNHSRAEGYAGNDLHQLEPN